MRFVRSNGVTAEGRRFNASRNTPPLVSFLDGLQLKHLEVCEVYYWLIGRSFKDVASTVRIFFKLYVFGNSLTLQDCGANGAPINVRNNLKIQDV
jgi:hypothetical protein